MSTFQGKAQITADSVIVSSWSPSSSGKMFLEYYWIRSGKTFSRNFRCGKRTRLCILNWLPYKGSL